MLYHLLVPLAEETGVFTSLRYITVRTAAAVVVALALSLLLGPWFIATLRRLSVGQNIRDVGPQAHLVKAGTPTMGGLLILFSLTVATLLFARLDNLYVWIALGATLGFGAVGFIDDYIKVAKGRNLGLTSRQKLFGQLLVSAATGVAVLVLPESYGFVPTLELPLVDQNLHLGWFYVPFVMLVLIGASNAVNLTDGLDGLAIGSTLAAAVTYTILTYVAGHRVWADYLGVQSMPNIGEVTVYCGALVGACLGFMWFNCHPAEVFMGDIGSLALGGAIGTLAILSRQELLLVLVGGLFVLEALSVIIQVGTFKLFRRRVFRMAPLHHHFELKGWAEPKIIVRFWIVAGMFALLSIWTLKLR